MPKHTKVESTEAGAVQWQGKWLAALAGAVSLWTTQLPAVEGMWQPEQLPLIQSDLKAKGLAIDPKNLSDLLAFPMNAIVSLGGCSASFVSPQGLVVTNHHCAYGSIQYNSSAERNLIDKGFYAATLADELPAAPGSRIFVTESIQDVTGELLKNLKGVKGRARFDAIDSRRKGLISQCEVNPAYRCRIDSFLGDSSYRLTKQMEIKDVRLVYAPPSAIGKFGGDVDNWMWPRHTGDFAFYRAYVNKKGEPVAFDQGNVPYAPKAHLAIDSKGVEEGSFVMVAGYPGRTNRHRLAAEVAYTFEHSNPEVKDYLDRRIALIESFKAKDAALGIKYAAQLAGLNNSSKNIEGKQDGYKAMGLLPLKAREEANLVASFKSGKNKAAASNYQALTRLLTEEQDANKKAFVVSKAMQSDLLRAAQRLYRLAREQEKPNAERESGYQERDLDMFQQNLVALSRRFDRVVDQAMWTLALGDVKAADAKLQKAVPAALSGLLKADEAALSKTLASYYDGSVMLDEGKRIGLMKFSRKELEALKDPFMQLAVALYNDDMQREAESKERDGNFQLLRSQFMQNVVAYQAKRGKVVYPDANSTLRITYGTVQGYKNRQGVPLAAFTKLEEIAAKNTGKEPFDVPAREMELIQKRTYGAYTLSSLQTVPVNFLADLDITGGNSGSATLNSKAELTGLVFDGTIDGVISDWAFDPAYTRSIHVDVRYMLWVLDEFDHATRLLDEMGVERKLTSTKGASNGPG